MDCLWQAHTRVLIVAYEVWLLEKNSSLCFGLDVALLWGRGGRDGHIHMTLHGVLDLWFTTELSNVPMHKPIENQCILQRKLGFSRWAIPPSLLWFSNEPSMTNRRLYSAVKREAFKTHTSGTIAFYSVNQNALVAFLDLLIILR